MVNIKYANFSSSHIYDTAQLSEVSFDIIFWKYLMNDEKSSVYDISTLHVESIVVESIVKSIWIFL